MQRTYLVASGEFYQAYTSIKKPHAKKRRVCRELSLHLATAGDRRSRGAKLPRAPPWRLGNGGRDMGFPGS